MAQFNFSYEPGTSLEQMIGFEAAGQIWARHLQDDVEINIHIEGTNQLSPNIVGGALPAVEAKQKYEDVSEALQADVTSALDITVTEFLPTQKEFSITANGDTDIKKTKYLNATTANSKALGLVDSNEDQLDGYILFSDLSQTPSAQWDYSIDRSGSSDANSLDFLSMALHEVGHVLGFVSGVDDPGWLEAVLKGQEKIQEERRKGKQVDNAIKDEAMKFANPLDLFRYSTESAAQDKQDLSIGGDAYFSVDGGQTALANFSSGKATELGGDGYQASHWKYSSDRPLGILDPVLATNQRREISSIDLAAFDAIGWDMAEHPAEISLSALKDAVEVELAEQLGVSSEWLEDNSTAAAEALGQSRLKDVVDFIKESKVYEWGWSRSYWGWGRYRQEILGLFEQQSLFSTLDPESIAPPEDLEVIEDDMFYPVSRVSVSPQPSGPVDVAERLAPTNTIRNSNPVIEDSPFFASRPSPSLSDSDTLLQDLVETLLPDGLRPAILPGLEPLLASGMHSTGLFR